MAESLSQQGNAGTVWRLPFDFAAAQARGYPGSETEAYTDLGRYLESRGQLEDALTALRRATELDPGDSRVLYYLGGLLFRLGRSEEAVEALERSAALAPDHWVTAYNLGKALARMSRHEDAVEAFSRAVALNPSGTSPLVQRAQSLAALGRRREAIDDLEAALRRDPQAKRFRRLLESLREERVTPPSAQPG